MTNDVLIDDDGDGEEEVSDSWKEFRRGIDEKLDRHRPNRAGVGETKWREPVYTWARNHMPDETHLVRNVAKQEVDRREGLATKRGNKHVRAWMKGQAPLSWLLLGALPIKVGEIRVRADAATPEDLEESARAVRESALGNYNEEVLLATGFDEIAKRARQSGFDTAADIGDQPPRRSEAA